MVLMPRPYKEDKEIEQELKEERELILKHPCTFSPQRGFKETKFHSIGDVTKKLVDRMAMQELQIKYLLDMVRSLRYSGKIALEKIEELGQPKVIVVEEISKEDGKKFVEDYFKEHGTADIEELMLNLHIPIQTVVEIIDELHDEGKLVPKGE